MIQSKTWVNHPQHGRGQVIKVHPYSRTAQVAFGITTRTCQMDCLTLAKVNLYTPIKTADDVVESVVKIIDERIRELLQYNTPQASGGHVELQRLRDQLKK